MKLRRRQSDARLVGSVRELRQGDKISYTDPATGDRVTCIIVYLNHVSEWGNDEVIMTIQLATDNGMVVDAEGMFIFVPVVILTDNNLNNGTLIYRKATK